ncbi:MAG: DUF4837 family protein [Bacteroidales bacterium]|nr:DUF4837 family protein [Bacteroidales bacterium]
MKRIAIVLAALALLAGCKSTKTLLPNVSGKAGEVIVVIEKADWEGNLGNAVRELLACDCPYLAQKEPLYTLVNVAPGGFGDLLKIHRNIVFFTINPGVDSTGVIYRHDVWAAPQCLVQVSAKSSAQAAEFLESDGRNIVGFIEQAERDRVIRNSIRYEERIIAEKVGEVFGGSPHFPMGYKIKKLTPDFAWIADEKQYTIQGVLIYRYPATGAEDELTLDRIVARRNEYLKANVPGMFDNTWMTTGDYMPPQIEFLRYRGRSFAQVRGLWEVENDYMGGPFVSQSFYSPDGEYVIVAEAFVYAPKYDKRQYLRQVESILFSWEWNKD